MFSTTMSIMGEGRIEGIHAAEEFRNSMMDILQSEEVQNRIMEEVMMEVKDPYNDELIEMAYNEKMAKAMQSIDVNGKRVAAFTFTAQAPILATSHVIQFAKLAKRGYDSQRGF